MGDNRGMTGSGESIKLVLGGSLISKKNSREPRYRNVKLRKTGEIKRVRFMGASEAYRAWERTARWEAKIQLKAQGIHAPFTGPARIAALRVYYKGTRVDYDAALTAVMDCLEGLAWVNDRQVKGFGRIDFIHDKANPRTEVIIEREEEPRTSANKDLKANIRGVG